MDDKDTFQDMIPQYINDQLDPEEKAAFESQLAMDQHLKEELEEFSLIKSSYAPLKKTMPAPSPEVFSRIMDNVAAQEAENKVKSAPRDSVIDLLVERFKEFFAVPQLAWSVAAVQMAVILFFVVYNPAIEKQPAQFQTLSSSTAQMETGLQANVIFHETVMEKEIRSLLNEIDATIISGPSESGLYVLLIKDAKTDDQVLKILKSSVLVKFAQKKY